MNYEKMWKELKESSKKLANEAAKQGAFIAVPFFEATVLRMEEMEKDNGR